MFNAYNTHYVQTFIPECSRWLALHNQREYSATRGVAMATSLPLLTYVICQYHLPFIAAITHKNYPCWTDTLGLNDFALYENSKHKQFIFYKMYVQYVFYKYVYVYIIICNTIAMHYICVYVCMCVYTGVCVCLYKVSNVKLL